MEYVVGLIAGAGIEETLDLIANDDFFRGALFAGLGRGAHVPSKHFRSIY